MGLLKITESDLTGVAGSMWSPYGASTTPGSTVNGIASSTAGSTSAAAGGTTMLAGGTRSSSTANTRRGWLSQLFRMRRHGAGQNGVGNVAFPEGPAATAMERMRAVVAGQAAKPLPGWASATTTTAAGATATISGQATAMGVGGAHGTGIVIDGSALAVALRKENEDTFLALCQQCAAVVCCRVSPMQKAQVARLVKRKANAVTVAIGDGANDVSMIQAAHIGVGISGREGRAAVQAADYAFGQFRWVAACSCAPSVVKGLLMGH